MKKFLLVCIIFMVLVGCKKQVVKVAPSINSVTSTSSISGTTATIGGSISADGGDPITARGVVYGLSPNPTISDSKTSAGAGIGTFSSIISGLTPGQTYYFRTFATNSVGTSYGDQITFTSPAVLSSVTTTAATAITSTSATSGGNVTIDGGSPITARGICWGTAANPTTSGSKTTDGTGIGSFTSAIIGLTPGATYYARAYATNAIGTSYGDQITIAAIAVVVTVTTTAATAITSTTATSGGNVSADGGSSITARGVCWGTAINPTIALSTKTTDGTGTGSFVSNLINLQPGTIYYVRSYATNSLGTSYGSEVSFTSLQPPTATTAAATSLASTTATLNGTVNANNQSTTVTFEYGTTASYGQTINATPNTISGSTNTSVSANLTGLTISTMYHCRVKAVSSSGTTYGSDVTFTTLGTGGSGIIFNPDLTYGSVSDNDGNNYKTIQIGTQTWMAENLKTGKYNDGTAIPLVTGTAEWAALSTPGYCWYNNDAATYKATYGALYNWFTVNTGKLCPTGWHVPTDAEWTTLITYLGGESVAGGKLKEAGTSHWFSPNTGATNSSGYTALPGGYRNYYGSFWDIGIIGFWWSSTEFSTDYAWYRYMDYNSSNVYRNYLGYKQYGFSVRCLKDGNQGTAVLPVLTTTTVTVIASTTATSGGNISNDGGATVTVRGVCWSTSSNPTTALSTKTTDGTGTSSFTSSLTGLTANTTYYVRAYATNSVGTAYGTQVTFTTLPATPSVTAPTVTTASITNLTATSAVSGGTISSDGGATVTARGVCWATFSTPTISNNTSSNGTGTGSFVSTITGLVANTIYYVRAYATNSAGTAYGGAVTVSTYPMAVVNTSAVTAITSTTATCGGTITSGLAMVTANGVCWSTTQNPTTANSKTTNSTGNVSFTSSITGLTAGTTYYVRAYATYGGGTSYGSQVTFTTASSGLVAPTLTTTAVSAIASTTATSGGNISSDGGATVTARGVCWSTTSTPTTANSKTTDGTGSGGFTSSLLSLSANTTYYVRAYATNSAGTAYGTQVSFTTTSSGLVAPTLTTTSVSAITSTTATSGGNISSDGGASVTARGVCWSTTSTPTTANSKSTDGIGTGGFTSSLISLSANTTYYVRAYATNSAGTAYGTQVSFTTLQVSGSTVTDNDGNNYSTVTIGTQVWMTSNLKTTKYKDGIAIPLVTDDTAWMNLVTHGYCWYDNLIANKDTYGALYNWYTVNSGKLCPTGWHVPSDSEWTTLMTYLGNDARKLKETGTSHWISNTGATNETGFAAVPGGQRPVQWNTGLCYDIGHEGYWWTSTQSGFAWAYFWHIKSYKDYAERDFAGRGSGYSVRCLKD